MNANETISQQLDDRESRFQRREIRKRAISTLQSFSTKKKKVDVTTNTDPAVGLS